MSFSAVPTVATGDTWTAAQHNTYLRDNMAAIFVGTAAGDTDYYTSAVAKARLPIGAANTIKKSTGTAPAWTTVAALLGATPLVGSQAAGDVFYGASASALARLAIGAANTIQKSTGSAPAWTTVQAILANAAMVASQAAGDLFYASGASAIARLAKGTQGKFLRAGASLPEYAEILGARQGGSSTIWATAGTTNYTPIAFKIQAGVKSGSVTGGLLSDNVTFPEAFSYAPIVLITLGQGGPYPDYMMAFFVYSITASGFGYQAKWAAGSWTQDVNWLAIGPP